MIYHGIIALTAFNNYSSSQVCMRVIYNLTLPDFLVYYKFYRSSKIVANNSKRGCQAGPQYGRIGLNLFWVKAWHTFRQKTLERKMTGRYTFGDNSLGWSLSTENLFITWTNSITNRSQLNHDKCIVSDAMETLPNDHHHLVLHRICSLTMLMILIQACYPMVLNNTVSQVLYVHVLQCI